MRIILCGFGVVGQSFAKLLISRSDDLYARYGLKPRIVGICDRNGSAVDASGPVSYTHLTLPTNREV